MGNTRREIFLIRVVNAICVFFGVAGVIMAFVVGSRSMLLDGLYSFVQSIFILFSAIIVRLLTKGESRNYQFGYAAFEPFFIVLRSLVLIMMLLVLAFEAVFSLIGGGYLIRADIASAFTLFSVVVCAMVWRVLRHSAAKWNSPILEAEARSWFCDTMLSIAVLVGFLISYILSSLGYMSLAAVVDPVITLVFIVALLPSLITQLVSNTHELLGGAPSQDVQKQMKAIISSYRKKLPMRDFRVYSTKHGRTFLFNVYIQLDRELPLRQLDGVRKSMLGDIHNVFSWVDADIIFTVDPSWYELSSMAPVADVN